MIILDKKAEILSFKIKPDYNNDKTIYCSSASGYHWGTAPDKTYRLSYNLTYTAEDRESNSSFMECISRLIMTVSIEDEQQDTLAALQALQEFDEFVQSYIHNNTANSAFKLQFSGLESQEHRFEQMKKQINGLKFMKPFEEKSDLEKRIDEDFQNQTFSNFRSETLKSTAPNPDGTRTATKIVTHTITFGTNTNTPDQPSKNKGIDK